MAKTRFDMEQEIMDCWHITDDLDVLMENVLERDLNADTITNVLLGLKTLYQMKFERLFDTFETLVHEREFDSKFPAGEFSFPESSEDITIQVADFNVDGDLDFRFDPSLNNMNNS